MHLCHESSTLSKGNAGKPEEAMKALREEVLKAVKIGIWEPIHVKSLTEEQQKMIIP
jgi:hypothetical protein